MKEAIRSVLTSNITTGILLTSAVLVVAFIATATLGPNEDTSTSHRVTPAFVDDWEDLAAVGRFPGESASAVQVIVFSDYQCPFCKTMYGALQGALRRHEDVSTSYFHFPLPQHDHAYPAAIAAECAARQGRFRTYSQRLFREQENLGDISFVRLAHKSNIPDTKRFASCVDEEKTRLRVESDIRHARTLHLQTTPTVIVNGTVYEGSLTPEAFDQAIQHARSEERGSSAS